MKASRTPAAVAALAAGALLAALSGRSAGSAVGAAIEGAEGVGQPRPVLGVLPVAGPWLPAGGQSPTTQPDEAASEDPRGPSDPRDRSRRAAGPLVAATAAGLLLVMLALTIWTVHWGQRLRRRARPRRRGAEAAAVDPWIASGQRLGQDDTEE